MEGELKAGRYLVEKKIKEGGQGIVYSAYDNRLKCRVALKVIKPQYLHDPQFRARIAQEVLAAAAINHPGIARPLDFVESDQEIFIVYEFVEGVTLRDQLGEKRRFTNEEIVKVGIKVAVALAKAHEQGFAHRDLKPENIMLSPEPDGSFRIRILDFGLAKRMKVINLPPAVSTLETFAGTFTTNQMAILGTKGYWSPEQLPESPKDPVDARTDIFSLGVVLYEMAAGENPFCDEDDIESIKKTLSLEPPPLQERNPEVHSELDGVIRKCLHKRRVERYQSATELLGELERLRDKISSRHIIHIPILPPIRISRGWARMLILLIQLGYLVMYGATFHYFFPALQRLRFLFEARNLEIYLGLSTLCGTALHIYLLSAVAWDYPDSGRLFRGMFPAILIVDSIWAMSPLLVLHKLGGWVLMCITGLAFLPFAQRRLMLAVYSPDGGRVSSVTGETPS